MYEIFGGWSHCKNLSKSQKCVPTGLKPECSLYLSYGHIRASNGGLYGLEAYSLGFHMYRGDRVINSVSMRIDEAHYISHCNPSL